MKNWMEYTTQVPAFSYLSKSVFRNSSFFCPKIIYMCVCVRVFWGEGDVCDRISKFFIIIIINWGGGKPFKILYLYYF